MIPGTKRVSRVEENTAADAVELNAEQFARLNDLTPASSERHNVANMATIDADHRRSRQGRVAIEEDASARDSLNAVAPLALREGSPRSSLHCTPSGETRHSNRRIIHPGGQSRARGSAKWFDAQFARRPIGIALPTRLQDFSL